MAIRGARKIIEDMRRSLKNAVPWSLTFKSTGTLSAADIKRLENELKEGFERWAATWITPRIDELESKLKPVTKR